MAQQRRFKHSVAYWCLHDTEWQWDFERICEAAKELGIESVELLPAPLLPQLKNQGIGSGLAFNGMPDPPFAKGLNNADYHEQVIGRTKEAIEVCHRFAIPNVIAFTGYKWRDATDRGSEEISLAEGADNCVAALRELSQYAERNQVQICLEQLNTRDDSHPMKGHPGYQGNDIDYCASIVRQVDSPWVKLLFDVYHVQAMHGDVIRRIEQYGDLIGYIHTAGNPGRGEMDDSQEIHYRGIVRALGRIGYSGFVGHEFIPTRDPLAGLRQAVELFET